MPFVVTFGMRILLKSLVYIVGLLLFPIVLFAAAEKLPTKVPNATWTGIERVVAVGDIHGDFNALVNILISSKLINQYGEWTGNQAHLVLMGDLIAGEKGSVQVLDLVMKIQAAAEQAGGRVHALMGNHDLLVASGKYSRLKKEEREAFLPSDMAGGKKTRAFLDSLFLGDGVYTRWTANRPMAIMINDQLYVHAGMDERVLGMSLQELNSITKAWIKYFQGRGEIPHYSTEWVVGLQDGKFSNSEGPAFARDFKVTRRLIKKPNKRPSGAVKRKIVREILEQYGAKRMVIGHVATPDGDVLLEHPYYGSDVIITDSRISDMKRGRLSMYESTPAFSGSRYFERTYQALSVRPFSCKNLFVMNAAK